MSNIIQNIKANVNSILSLRDSLGVALKEVYLVTRTWSGSEIGDGEQTEVKVRVLPSPRIVEFKHNLKILEGGSVERGDVLLKMLPKETFPEESMIDGSSEEDTVEKFYEVGGELYRAVSVSEKHVTWSVLVRKISDK